MHFTLWIPEWTVVNLTQTWICKQTVAGSNPVMADSFSSLITLLLFVFFFPFHMPLLTIWYIILFFVWLSLFMSLCVCVFCSFFSFISCFIYNFVWNRWHVQSSLSGEDELDSPSSSSSDKVITSFSICWPMTTRLHRTELQLYIKKSAWKDERHKNVDMR